METRVVEFRTPFNVLPSEGEKYPEDAKDMCTPDMAMSVAELLVRYAQGRSLGMSPNLMYGGDDYFPDVRKLDLTEQQEAYEYQRERIKELQESLKKKMELRKEAKKDNQPPVDEKPPQNPEVS